MPWGVDQDEDRLVVLVRSHQRVVRSADVDRGVVDGTWRPAEERIELLVVAGGEEHGVVPQPGGTSPQRQLQGEGGRRRGGPAESIERRCRHRRGKQVGEQMAGVGVGDHDVGAHPFASGQADPGSPSALDEHLGHVGVEPELDTTLDATVVQRATQHPQPAAHVPRAEGLLDVRHHDERSRGASWVRAGVRRVAVEQHPRSRVLQVASAQAAKRGQRSDRAQVPYPQRLPQQVPRPSQRRLQERRTRDLPHRRGVVDQRGPLRPGTSAEGRIHRLGGAGPRAVGDVQCHAVGEAVVEGRVDRHEVDVVLERGSLAPDCRLQEQVAIDGWEGEQRRPGVEDEAVSLKPPELPPVRRSLLEDDDRVSLGRQSCGDGQPAHPGTDHHDPAHGSTRPFHVRVPALRAANDRTVR